jgi:nucleotide-binding universal stress UspA family protein
LVSREALVGEVRVDSRVLEHLVINIVSGAGRLVVGASGSPGSLAAVRYALRLAHRHDVPVVAVMAWVPPEGDLAERRWPCPDLRRVWADDAGKRLVSALGDACGGVPASLDIRLVVIRGNAGPALVQVADSGDDVLVVGAGRRGMLSRMWGGRVSRYCVSHARCPVLAVPHPATARELGLRPGAWAARRRDLSLDRVMREWDAAA